MNKPEIIKILIDDHGFSEDELKDLTVKELKELLPIETEKRESTGTGYYPKSNLFGQSIQDVDRKSGNLKAIETEVDYRIINFKSGQIKFVKGQEVSKDELALMSDYQKEFYLDEK